MRLKIDTSQVTHRSKRVLAFFIRVDTIPMSGERNRERKKEREREREKERKRERERESVCQRVRERRGGERFHWDLHWMEDEGSSL